MGFSRGTLFGGPYNKDPSISAILMHTTSCNPTLILGANPLLPTRNCIGPRSRRERPSKTPDINPVITSSNPKGPSTQ